MTKKWILLFLFSIFFTKAYTQDKFKPEWTLGAAFGVTFPSLSFDPTLQTTTFPRYQGGLAIRYISEKHLGLIAELNFSQQGWKQDFSKYPIYEDTHSLNYLSVPIMTHIYFGDKIRMFVNFGPNFGYLLSQSEYMNDALKTYMEINNSDPKYFPSAQIGAKAQNRFTYGLLMGVGVEGRTKIGDFSLEGRYGIDFSDIYHNKQTDPYQRSANRLLVLRLTYYVKLF